MVRGSVAATCDAIIPSGTKRYYLWVSPSSRSG